MASCAAALAAILSLWHASAGRCARCPRAALATPTPVTLAPSGIEGPPPGFRQLRPPLIYEIIYAEGELAARAEELLDGAALCGRPIRVTLSKADLDGVTRKVNVQDVLPDVPEAQVLALFEQVGPVKRSLVFKDTRFGEVRFKTSDQAWAARTELDGISFLGRRLRLELDCSHDYLNKVLVHGLSPGVMWQELKDLFKTKGTVTFAAIHGGRTARVVFETRDEAVKAMKDLNKSKIRGGDQRYINVCRPFSETEDSAEVRVTNFLPTITVEAFEKHFASAGKVVSVHIEEAQLPPEFCV